MKIPLGEEVVSPADSHHKFPSSKRGAECLVFVGEPQLPVSSREQGKDQGHCHKDPDTAIFGGSSMKAERRAMPMRGMRKVFSTP